MRSWCFAGILLLLAIGLRLTGLQWQSLWFDEIAAIRMAESRDLFVSDFHPPFFFQLLATWIFFAGDGALSVRLFVALTGIISLLLFAYVANRHFGKQAILWSIGLSGFSFGHFWYSQEVRAYILLFLESTLVIEAYRRWLANEKHSIIYLVVANTLLVYTHYAAALLFLLSQALQIIVKIVRLDLSEGDESSLLRRYFIVVAWCIILSLPLVPLISLQCMHVQNGGLWVKLPRMADVYLLFARLIFHTPLSFGFWLVIVTNIIFVLATIHLWLTNPCRRYLIGWSLSMPLIALFLSTVFHVEVFVTKIFMVLLPIILLILTHFLLSIKSEIAIVGMIGYWYLQGYLIRNYYVVHQKEDWRALGQYLATAASAEDCYYFTAPGTRLALDYYHPIGDEQLLESESISDCSGNSWLIYALTPQSFKSVKEMISGMGYQVNNQRRFTGIIVANIGQAP